MMCAMYMYSVRLALFIHGIMLGQWYLSEKRKQRAVCKVFGRYTCVAQDLDVTMSYTVAKRKNKCDFVTFGYHM